MQNPRGEAHIEELSAPAGSRGARGELRGEEPPGRDSNAASAEQFLVHGLYIASSDVRPTAGSEAFRNRVE
jgi:hypothetical protein